MREHHIKQSPLLSLIGTGGGGFSPNTIGAVSAGPLSVEDVFSTYLWNGNYDTTQSAITINNGINLSGKGGLVWTKHRNYANSHQLYDTERGAGKPLYSNVTNGEGNNPVFSSFNSNGFSLTAGTFGTDALNGDVADNYCSWTFRKAPGFFDVVKYTGSASTDQTVSHDLNAVPGFIMIKNLDNSESEWIVYHRSLDTPDENWMNIKVTGQIGPWGSSLWNLTSTTFKADGDLGLNNLGTEYIAYIFAHNEAVFGENGDQSIISCGSFTGNSSADGPEVNLGWEPQWVLVKPYKGTRVANSWRMYDVMRGITAGPSSNGDLDIQPNSNAIEGSQNYGPTPTPTGFKIEDNNLFYNDSGTSYIYVAIRRGPMKTPTDATTVFDVINRSGTGSATTITTNIDSDFAWTRRRAGTNNVIVDRLRGNYNILLTERNNAETNNTNFTALSGNATNNTFALGTDTDVNGSTYTYINYFLKRAPGFFDMVAYTGDGTSNRSVPHNLGVVPELYISKRRDSTGNWLVYSSAGGAGKYLILENNQAFGTYPYFGTPTEDNIVLNNAAAGTANGNGENYITYLFATCPGVSKVGSYTGTGTTLNIDCGFTSGARFVMVKRTDDTGNWFIWDTARGIVAGNDPYILTNSISPSSVEEVTDTDWIDPYSAGFTLTPEAPNYLGNVSGGSYIFLAIA